MSVVVYTDGGCSGNPGPGGWAYVISDADSIRERSGAEGQTTNNRMELTAVIEALDDLRRQTVGRGVPVELHTDSRYVQLGITSWVSRWQRNGWRTAGGDSVKNVELWVRLKELSSAFTIEWRWVKGHDGVALNERCDALVRQAILTLR